MHTRLCRTTFTSLSMQNGLTLTEYMIALFQNITREILRLVSENKIPLVKNVPRSLLTLCFAAKKNSWYHNSNCEVCALLLKV